MARKETQLIKLKEKMIGRQKNIDEQTAAALEADKAQIEYVLQKLFWSSIAVDISLLFQSKGWTRWLPVARQMKV